MSPSTNYIIKTVSVKQYELPMLHGPKTDRVQIANLGEKKFRNLIKKKSLKEDFQVFQVLAVPNNKDKTHDQRIHDIEFEYRDKRLVRILEEYSDVFKDGLPPGLLPTQAVDHCITVDENKTIPHRGLFQLIPADLLATKEYITDLLRKRNIRPSISPYGALLFFVKHKDKLRGVVDYRALNRITKKNSSPLPRSDEMFDRLGKAKYFSKMDLKTGFHQFG